MNEESSLGDFTRQTSAGEMTEKMLSLAAGHRDLLMAILATLPSKTLSRRDRFALVAMNALLAKPTVEGELPVTFEFIAEASYQMADFMIAEANEAGVG
jgi:hypothetical protein